MEKEQSKKKFELKESPSRSSFYNFIARFALPFQRFKDSFLDASLYRKITQILNLFLAGIGSILIGEVEIGLGLFAAYGALGFLFVYVINQLATGFITLSVGDAIVVLVIVGFGFLAVWYASFKKHTKDNLFKNRGEPLNGSFIASFFIKLAKSIAGFIRDYNKLDKESDAKHKIFLRVSWFVMGLPLFFMNRILNGFVMLGLQLLYIFYMIYRGASDLVGLFTLHQDGVFSNATLVTGIISVIITIAFIALYIINIRTVYKAVDEENRSISGPGFKNEVKSLANDKFYISGLIVPVLGALVFTIIPLTFMILVAFTNYSGKSGTGGVIPNPIADTYLGWTGFDTFKRLFADPQNLRDMLTVFSWTMIWAILATFTCYFGGLLLAMLLNKKSIKGKVVYRSLLVISMALPQFVSLLVMKTLFADNGAVNTMLYKWGIIQWMQQVGWISDLDAFVKFWSTPALAKTLIIIINMWVGVPYYMLLLSGLLINIPGSYYEAARIEGASKWKQFSKITFPYILHMTTPALITSFVSNINNFNVIWFLTGNADGVADDTDILITWLYKITMKGVNDYNLGAAIGIVMFIISASVSLIVYQRSSSYKDEEAFR